MNYIAQKECQVVQPMKCTIQPEYKILALKGGSELEVCFQHVGSAVLQLINKTKRDVHVSKMYD